MCAFKRVSSVGFELVDGDIRLQGGQFELRMPVWAPDARIRLKCHPPEVITSSSTWLHDTTCAPICSKIIQNHHLLQVNVHKPKFYNSYSYQSKGKSTSKSFHVKKVLKKNPGETEASDECVQSPIDLQPSKAGRSYFPFDSAHSPLFICIW